MRLVYTIALAGGAEGPAGAGNVSATSRIAAASARRMDATNNDMARRIW
jgi:hypothetical protein